MGVRTLGEGRGEGAQLGKKHISQSFVVFTKRQTEIKKKGRTLGPHPNPLPKGEGVRRSHQFESVRRGLLNRRRHLNRFELRYHGRLITGRADTVREFSLRMTGDITLDILPRVYIVPNPFAV